MALAQVTAVNRSLADVFPGVTTETVVVATQGDIDKVTPLTEIGGRGVFTNALERELAHGRIDAAVHSAKDLPSLITSELPIVAFPERVDPRDVLVSRLGLPLAELPDRPVIGTSSRRREAQIRQLRPDAQIVSLRGNIDTRLRKAMQPEYDAIVLAAAGLARMGWDASVTEYFPIDVLVPAPGQGALAIQTAMQSPGEQMFAVLDRAEVSSAVRAERAFLAAIGAGCTMPVGAHVYDDSHGLTLVAFLESEQGHRVARRTVALDSEDVSGQAAAVAREMQAEVEFCQPTRWQGVSLPRLDLVGATVAVTRPKAQSHELIRLLSDRGATALSLPAIRIESPVDRAPLDAALQALANGAFTWVVFTSANAVEAVVHAASDLGARDACLRAIRAAAVGEATAAAARRLGLDVAVVAEIPTAEGLVATLLPRLQAGDRVLYPRSSLSREVLPNALRDAGIDVTAVEAYRTSRETHVSPEVMAYLRSGAVDAFIFASPSSVTALQALLGNEWPLVKQAPAVCAGPVTAAAVREAGLHVAVTSPDPGASAMVDGLAEYWNRQAPAPSRLIRNSDRLQTSERIAGR
ncbi:MAG: hydroxymethylbilane synthase [Thermomicrobiales bacterium]|nr:hydroxymethylbilane synthase [Thermomicrobiales bacterium]